MTNNLPAPKGLAARGRAYWGTITEKYEMTISETELLREVCRTLDNLDALAAVVAADGATTTGSQGQIVVHPALTEARGQRLVLHRLIAALALPAEEIPSGAVLRSMAGGKANAARSKAGR